IRVVDVNKRIVQQGHSVNRGRFSGATAIIPYEDSAFGNDHGAAGDGNPFPRFRLCVDLDEVSRRNLTGRVVETRHLVPPKSTFQELLYGIVRRLISIQSVLELEEAPVKSGNFFPCYRGIASSDLHSIDLIFVHQGSKGLRCNKVQIQGTLDEVDSL